jgi:hypothetical protein
VLCLALLAFGQVRFAQIDLIFKIEPAALIDHPDRAADGRQRGDDAVEHRVVILRGGQVRLGQLRNLANQIPDLLFCLFDEFRINRFGAHESLAERLLVSNVTISCVTPAEWTISDHTAHGNIAFAAAKIRSWQHSVRCRHRQT